MNEDISPFFYFGIKAMATKLNLHFVCWIRCRKVFGQYINITYQFSIFYFFLMWNYAIFY